jgi:hypothetical protein
MTNSISWKKICLDKNIETHDFSKSPLIITASDIKKSCQNFKKTSEKEVRILCKQDTRESRPDIFIEKGLFLLPNKNGEYAIVKGEGYMDLPDIETVPEVYNSKIDFDLDTVKVGNSEMQHLDYAYAVSIIRTFMEDSSLTLTIRGRKYTPKFSFNVGQQRIDTESVQTEVDAGYEGKDKVVLIEAKNSKTKNTIIRQLYYPYRQWQKYTEKEVFTLFFEKSKGGIYKIWQFKFNDMNDYNSIELVKAKSYIIK